MESKNRKVLKTKRKRKAILLSKCAVCDRELSRFVKEEEVGN